VHVSLTPVYFPCPCLLWQIKTMRWPLQKIWRGGGVLVGLCWVWWQRWWKGHQSVLFGGKETKESPTAPIGSSNLGSYFIKPRYRRGGDSQTNNLLRNHLDEDDVPLHDSCVSVFKRAPTYNENDDDPDGAGATNQTEFGKMYCDIIRMNAENKINANNSWGLKLIE